MTHRDLAKEGYVARSSGFEDQSPPVIETVSAWMYLPADQAKDKRTKDFSRGCEGAPHNHAYKGKLAATTPLDPDLVLTKQADMVLTDDPTSALQGVPYIKRIAEHPKIAFLGNPAGRIGMGCAGL